MGDVRRCGGGWEGSACVAGGGSYLASILACQGCDFLGLLGGGVGGEGGAFGGGCGGGGALGEGGVGGEVGEG